MTTIQTDQAARPDILEKLTYHRHERDDMTLDDCLEYLANRWKKIPGRPERALIMQITELLAAAPQKAVAASGEPVAQESDDLVDWDRISEAAKQACNEYGQWMPERWLQLFVNAYNRGKS